MQDKKQGVRVEAAGKVRAPRDPERRKRQITEAAAEIIAQEGSKHLTHRRVAERAGVPLGSTTQYFKSIDDLVRAGLACLAQQIEQRNQEMLAHIGEKTMGSDLLAKFVVTYLADEHQVKSDAMFYAAALCDPEVGGLWNRMLEKSMKSYEPFVDPERLRMVSAFLTGLVVDSALYRTPFDPDAVRSAIKSIMGEA